MVYDSIETQIETTIFNIKLFIMRLTNSHHWDFILDKLIGERIHKRMNKDAVNFLMSIDMLDRFLLSFSESYCGCLGRTPEYATTFSSRMTSKELFVEWYLVVDNDYVNNCILKKCVKKYEQRIKRCTT